MALGIILTLWGSPGLRALALLAMVAVVGTAAVATAVKYAVRRARPRDLPGFYSSRHDRYSFPSGHATRLATIAVVVGTFEPALALPGWGLALAVSACRVALGVHYPSDVLAGLAIGAGGAWLLVSRI